MKFLPPNIKPLIDPDREGIYYTPGWEHEEVLVLKQTKNTWKRNLETTINSWFKVNPRHVIGLIHESLSKSQVSWFDPIVPAAHKIAEINQLKGKTYG